METKIYEIVPAVEYDPFCIPAHSLPCDFHSIFAVNVCVLVLILVEI